MYSPSCSVSSVSAGSLYGPVPPSLTAATSIESSQENDGKKIYEWEGEGLKLELPADSAATVKLKTVYIVHSF